MMQRCSTKSATGLEMAPMAACCAADLASSSTADCGGHDGERAAQGEKDGIRGYSSHACICTV